MGAGPFAELGPALQIQLAPDLRPMAFHGSQAHVQPLGDLGVGVSGRDEPKHLDLAISQLGGPKVKGGQSGADGGMQIGLAAENAADRDRELVRRRGRDGRGWSRRARPGPKRAGRAGIARGTRILAELVRRRLFKQIPPGA